MEMAWSNHAFEVYWRFLDNASLSKLQKIVIEDQHCDDSEYVEDADFLVTMREIRTIYIRSSGFDAASIEQVSN
jgi:hypothetical protein